MPRFHLLVRQLFSPLKPPRHVSSKTLFMDGGLRIGHDVRSGGVVLIQPALESGLLELGCYPRSRACLNISGPMSAEPIDNFAELECRMFYDREASASAKLSIFTADPRELVPQRRASYCVQSVFRAWPHGTCASSWRRRLPTHLLAQTNSLTATTISRRGPVDPNRVLTVVPACASSAWHSCRRLL